jgi:dihydroorotase
MKIHIQGGTLIDPAAGTEQQQDIFIAAGKIVAIGNAPADFQAEKTIDAKGLSIAPGLVDLSARLREPGYEHKATLDGRGALRRRDESRVSAGHRSDAR